MSYAIAFFVGALLCNSLPHLTSSLQGQPFPTPFARPRGIGLSPPLVNFLWGLANLVAGTALLVAHPIKLGINPESASMLAGILLLGIYLGLHFGKVQGDRVKDASPARSTPAS